MRRRVLAAVVVAMLALGAGVGYAATQSTASGATNVCVSDTNGLMRVADTCREAEHPLTIGGAGGSVQATQNGSFTVPWGESGTGKVLPLTGVTVSGRCDVIPGPFGGEGATARVLLEAPAGGTMDVFPAPFGEDPRVSSTLLPPAAGLPPGMSGTGTGTQHAILTANAATATITIGGFIDAGPRTCTYLWQAVEAPN